jgi:predicted transcriptional regulator
MQKKIVRSERREGLVYYHPLITREAYVGREVDLLVTRLFDGDRAALARFLAAGD